MLVERVCDAAGRKGTLLTNGCVRVILEEDCGMVPEFSFRRGGGYTNAHWIPHFRGNTELYNEGKHMDKWGDAMMFNLCGNCPCIPNFGPESTASGKNIPANGYTANGKWIHEKSGRGEDYVFQLSGMRDGRDFSFRKLDILIKDHWVHYCLICIDYDGVSPQPSNFAWHNTVGTPFLQAGCYLDGIARSFTTAPYNAIPGQHERLSPCCEFDYLDSVPFKDGSTGSLRMVPGMIGYTDFISGAVPGDADIGWSSVFNPVLEAVYMPFFQGPAGTTSAEEIPLLFNNFWLQYGGRPFWPWSKYSQGVDDTFAVGPESSISALAHGLDLSLDMDEIIGNPTYITLQPGDRKKLYFATMLSPIEESSGWEGLSKVEIESADSVILHERKEQAYRRLKIDSQFSVVKRIEKELNT